MSKVLVSGLINLETTLQIDAFPLNYFPVTYPFQGIHTTVAGVGYNISKALTILGNEVAFLSLIGKDALAEMVWSALEKNNISSRNILPELQETPQSVILFDRSGNRQIHVDLKDIQEQVYPEAVFEREMDAAECLVLCNINFSRPFLEKARQAGKLIATDVHTIHDLEDSYNQDFMQNAQILFMSDEHLPTAPEEWAQRVMNRYGPDILVIGLGSEGALLTVRQDHFMERVSAVNVRPIVNTIGAGDALFSSFLHCYLESGDPYEAIRKAALFAAYKIGERSASEGYLDAQQLKDLFKNQN